MRGAVSAYLFIVLLSAPLAPVFADESVLPETSQISELSTENSNVDAAPAIDNAVLDKEEVPEEVVVETSTDTSDGEAALENVDTDETADTLPVVPSDFEQQDASDNNSSDEPDVATEEAESGEDTEVVAEAEEESEGTQETPAEPHVVVADTVTNDENRYSFSKDECTQVGDGSFYCAARAEVPEPAHTDRVFAAADASGDKEIYIERDGEVVQFTHNDDDDDAPQYDDHSDSMVWQRLIDGRYQIITYSFDEGEEVQLTHESYNSMEPARSGEATVWQAWIDNNWEIMLLENGNLTRLTVNTEPDIAPDINRNYIVWQSEVHGVWQANVYDRATGDIETIANTDGYSVENARFVLVYDTKHENGDIETRGYDLKNKEVVPLTATPAPVPSELPDPDETGEKRALLQSGSQLKPKTDDDEPLPPSNPNATSTGPVPNTGTSTTTIPDVVIGQSVSSSSSIPIEDLIIEPFQTASSSDSQSTVALEA